MLKGKFKKVLAGVLSVMMMATMLPLNAFASESNGVDQAVSWPHWILDSQAVSWPHWILDSQAVGTNIYSLPLVGTNIYSLPLGTNIYSLPLVGTNIYSLPLVGTNIYS